MIKQLLFTWGTRLLALIGVIAIIALLVQLFSNALSVSGVAYEMGYQQEAVATTSSMALRSMQPSFGHGVLYDEAIAAEVDEKIVKTGSLELIVDHADDSATAIKTLAEEKKGYVQSSTIREHQDGTKSGDVVIRIPADAYEQALDELKTMALVVQRETTSAEDVTEQYIDLSARLKNAQAQETRYVEILKEAKSVEDILKIEEALGNIRGYIESLTGQLQYLDNITGFSTITITLSEEPVITIAGKEFRPGTTVKEAGQAVVAIVQWLATAGIWIAIIGVCVGIPLLLIVWLVLLGVKKLYHTIKR